MSDSTVYNLLRGTTGKVYSATLPSNAEYQNITEFVLDAPHAKGDAFTLSFDVRLSAQGLLCAYLYNPKGNTHKNVYVNGTLTYGGSVDGYTKYEAGPEWRHVAITWKYVEVPVQPVDRIIPARMFRANTAAGTTVEVRNLMMVRGTEPAAWAPAGGETLAGVGALMSANLLDGIKPEITQYGSMADGVITSSTPKDEWRNVAAWPLPSEAFAENQTMHLGISAKWHSAAATSGTAWAAVKYEDAAGNSNNVDVQINGITTEWKRFSLSAVVPSGMRVVDFHISAQNLDAAYDATNLVLSYGSPLVLAISSSTLAWSAGILTTVRYYQLAAPTAATPTVPTSSSSLGSWTETEPTADVTKVLWTCERTVYADGTESWSKASKSTSYEAAKDAKSTATDAQSKAAALATVIHDGDDGVSVGKSADGGMTYPQGRTRQSSDAFEVLDDGGKVLSSFSKNKVQLGIGSSTSEIDMVGGHGKIFGYLDPQMADPGDGITELRISSDKFISIVGANVASIGAANGTIGEFSPSAMVSSDVDVVDNTVYANVRIAAHAVDGADAGYATRSTIEMVAADGATLNGAQILTAPTVLFYNEGQALNTAIPLSDSAGNYTRLKIFYKSDDSDYCSVEVCNPNGKTVALQIARPAYSYTQGAAPVMYVKSKIVRISGAIIDTVQVSTYGGGSNFLRMQKNLSGNYDTADKIGIIRVEGYKW